MDSPINKRKRTIDNDYDTEHAKKIKCNYSNEQLKSIQIIQSFFRMIIYYKRFIILQDNYSQCINNKKVENDTTFIGNDVSQIKRRYRYILKDNNHWYFFDIRELIKHLRNSNTNPYTNNIISGAKLKQISRICRSLRHNGYRLTIKNPLPPISQNTVKITNFFQKLQRYEIYTNIEQYINLHPSDLFILISKILVNYKSDYRIVEIYNYLKNNPVEFGRLYTIDVINNIFHRNRRLSEHISILTSDTIDQLSSYSEYSLYTPTDWNVEFIASDNNRYFIIQHPRTDNDSPEENAHEENAPQENAPDENAPHENTPDENAPAENAPQENAPQENTPDENTPPENAPQENAPDENAPEENAPEENAPEENAPENANNDTTEENTTNNTIPYRPIEYCPDEDIHAEGTTFVGWAILIQEEGDSDID